MENSMFHDVLLFLFQPLRTNGELALEARSAVQASSILGK